MNPSHHVGSVLTELNAKKGIWCEFCGKECSDEHLITFRSMLGHSAKELICTTCAKDLITCLQRSLTDALLTDKEIVKL